MAKLSSAARVASQDEELEVDYSERSGFLTGKSAALADWAHRKEKKAFEKVVAVLRTRRWQKNNPDRARENQRKTDKKKYAKRREKRSWLVKGTVLTCARCKTQWCRIPVRFMGPEPKYCPNGCLKKAMHERVQADPARRQAAIDRASKWQLDNPEKHRAHCRNTMKKKRVAITIDGDAKR